MDLDGVHKEDIHLSEKENANFMKKSSELGTTSDLVVVHTLICSLWSVSLIGLRNKTKHAPSFLIDHHLVCSSASFHFLEKSTQMAEKPKILAEFIKRHRNGSRFSEI